MKNYILFLIIGLLVVNTSCDSWLEETQFDKINSSTLMRVKKDWKSV